MSANPFFQHVFSHGMLGLLNKMYPELLSDVCSRTKLFFSSTVWIMGMPIITQCTTSSTCPFRAQLAPFVNFFVTSFVNVFVTPFRYLTASAA